MKTVVTAAIEDGMILGKDIEVGGKVAIKSGTKVDSLIKQKLMAFKLMTVEVLEAEDLANSYYEKIRVSEQFKKFQVDYNANLAAYKVAVDSFIYKKVPFRFQDLKTIADNLCPEYLPGKKLLSYINILLPKEADMSYAHGLNVALICKKMGRWFKLTPEEQDILVYCGFLYDIGKFMLPQDIIWKPDKLNKMEFDLIQTHPFYGYHMLSKSINVNEHILNATLMHHERCDGTGYPQGLNRDEIDKFAKMIAIADVYEAMTSARSYRAPMNPYKVIEIIKGDMFHKYDIAYISTFLNHILDELIGNMVSLSNGMQGEVIMNNPTALGRPVVKCEDIVVNLAQEKSINILAIV
ncbi:MAG: HD domain-containing protein [Lachnospiraceae bacterium]|nr:HD domain-containing protein [Lachnospiraceae bacterium]